MKPRSHKDTPRLTAKERALRWLRECTPFVVLPRVTIMALEKELQAHAREAVDRYKRRHG